MAIGVYSTRLYAGWFGGALEEKGHLFTVPTGHRAIIRHIAATQANPQNAYVELFLGAGGPILARYTPDARGTITALGEHLVLHEGEQLYGLQHLAGALGSINGYLLLGSGGPLVPSTLPQLGHDHW